MLNISTVKKSKCILSSWGNNQFKTKPLGHVILDCKTENGTSAKVDFMVVDVNDPPLLGLKDCIALNLVKRIEKVGADVDTKYPGILENFQDVFDGLGSFPRIHHIELEEGAVPQVQQCRRVPFSLLERLKNKLDELEKSGVLRKVDRPTAWVNPLVLVEKPNGDLRICIDPTPLNKVIRREHYLMPHPDDLLVNLEGYKFFSVLDLKDGFFQIKLDDESMELCTVSTPFGRYQFCRFPFGIKSGPELCQKYNYQCFGGLPGVHIVHDDLIIGGKTENEHNENLRRVLEMARKLGVKFNINKVQYKQKEVKFLGHVVGDGGVRPNEEYVKAIVDMEAPKDKKGVMRLLGMLKYLAKFIPNLSRISAPLRLLTRKDVSWCWNESQENSFKMIKNVLSCSPVLSYFKPGCPIEIQTDASTDGLGCCLLQEGKPVAFLSRSLGPSEQRYSQLEKEMLAIVYSVEKLHRFIYGYEVKVCSDHKPLVSVFKQKLDSVPARLQRMRMRCMKYNLNVVYMPGRDQLIADMLSRAALKVEGNVDKPEVLVHCMSQTIKITPEKLKQYQEAVDADEETTLLKDFCKTGWPNSKKQLPLCVRKYWNLKDQISESDGLIFLNHKVIVPKVLRNEVMEKIHSSHGGIEKCKMRARQIVYWPELANDIEQCVKNCSVCQQFGRNIQKEPLIPYPIPRRPWERIACDFMSSGGKTFLIIMDAYSDWLEVIKVQDKSARTVVRVCKDVFSRFGSPDVLVADNVPFNSFEMKRFAQEWNFELVTRSPGYAQSNGLAERAVGLTKTLLRKINWDDLKLSEALLEHRNLPLKHIGYSPAQLMFGRVCKTRVPVTETVLRPTVMENVKEKLKLRQDYYRKYYDRSAKPLPVLLQGDPILYKTDSYWKQGKVVESANTPRSYWVKGKDGSEVRRNRCHLKSRPLSPLRSYGSQNQREIEHNERNRQCVPCKDARPVRQKRLPRRFQD